MFLINKDLIKINNYTKGTAGVGLVFLINRPLFLYANFSFIPYFILPGESETSTQ